MLSAWGWAVGHPPKFARIVALPVVGDGGGADRFERAHFFLALAMHINPPASAGMRIN